MIEHDEHNVQVTVEFYELNDIINKIKYNVVQVDDETTIDIFANVC